MRKVELGTLLTLDGVTDRPELAFTSAPGEPPAIGEVMDAHLADVISREDAVLLGRRMYDEWAGYWPSSPHSRLPISSMGPPSTWSPRRHFPNRCGGNRTAVSGPLAEVVRSLQKGSDADLGVHGSIGVSQSLLAADRVDESAQWQPADARYSGTEDPRRQAEGIYLRVGARRVVLTRSSGRRGRTATTYDHPETCAGTFRRPSTPSRLAP